MSLHLLLLRLHSLLLLRRSGSRLSSSVEKDLKRERDADVGTRRRRKTEKWPLLPSLSPILSHSISDSLLPSFPSLYPSLSLFLSLLPLLSLSSVFHVGYAQAALPMPLTSVKPTVCMNRCSSVLLHRCNDRSLGAISLFLSHSSFSSRLPRPRREMLRSPSCSRCLYCLPLLF